MNSALRQELELVFGPGPYNGQPDVLDYIKSYWERESAARQAALEKERAEHELAMRELELRQKQSDRDHKQAMTVMLGQLRHGTATYFQFFSTIVQPNLTTVPLDSLLNTTSQAIDWATHTSKRLNDYKDNPNGGELQAFLLQSFQAASDACNNGLKVFDTRQHEYLHLCRADISFASNDCSSVHVGNVVLIMKIKAGSKSFFTNGEMGAMCFALKAVLDENPRRALIYGVYLCANIFCVLRAERDDDRLVYAHSNLIDTDVKGLESLFGLLKLGAPALGWNMPELPPVRSMEKTCLAECILGSGLTSEVYAYPEKSGCGDLVAKCFRSNFQTILDHERKILETLRTVEGVPRVVHEEGLMLVLSPRASEVSVEPMRLHYLKRKHIEQLVKILESAHGLNIVHRDIRLANIMFVTDSNDSTILISDWGFAMNTENYIYESHIVASYGTLTTACPRILEALSQSQLVVPRPADDLQALVRTLYMYRYEAGRRKVQTIQRLASSDVVYKLQEFWNQALAEEPWKTFDNLAKQCNYTELSEGISVFVQEPP